MAAVDDIVKTWRAPRKVVRGLLSHAASEPRAFSFLIAAQIVIFIGQWPQMARLAQENPDMPLSAQMLATALGLGAMLPGYYLIAALSHWIARLMGGQGSHYRARIALFWSLLAVSPLGLLQGLTAGFIGAGPQLTAVGVIAFGAFILIWFAAMRVAEFETGEA